MTSRLNHDQALFVLDWARAKLSQDEVDGLNALATHYIACDHSYFHGRAELIALIDRLMPAAIASRAAWLETPDGRAWRAGQDAKEAEAGQAEAERKLRAAEQARIDSARAQRNEQFRDALIKAGRESRRKYYERQGRSWTQDRDTWERTGELP